ncbi:MAG: DUF5320 family protein [Acetobacterium sp.]|nr:DUF5320 family protein [Acetobacterium sp.]
MPGRDRTGPRGRGSGSGKGFGRCSGINAYGFGKGCGCGRNIHKVVKGPALAGNSADLEATKDNVTENES